MTGEHRWTFVVPLLAASFLVLKFAHLIDVEHTLVIATAAALLLSTVFAAVHHAEVVALRIGEPLGSIVLAVAVTVIEVALIVSIMLSAADGGTEVARDTVFAAVMIVLNGIVGLCLLVGGVRYREQAFKPSGAGAGLGVIGTLATLALILPNYTLAVPGPVYSPVQLAFVGIGSILLYGQYLLFQTVTHREYFLDASDPDRPVGRPPAKSAVASLLTLLVALVAVVLLAKALSPAVERGVLSAGLPPAFVGVIIAAVVLLPEGLSALAAARRNRLQTALNLSLGSALASIGLTIPTVAAVSLLINKPLDLGLAAEHVVLLVLTLFISTLTLGTGRTTTLQGGVHLVIFGAFLIIAAVP
jgi:Ca2+:H+ antiporter